LEAISEVDLFRTEFYLFGCFFFYGDISTDDVDEIFIFWFRKTEIYSKEAVVVRGFDADIGTLTFFFTFEYVVSFFMIFIAEEVVRDIVSDYSFTGFAKKL